jgi:hypothetical protein
MLPMLPHGKLEHGAAAEAEEAAGARLRSPEVESETRGGGRTQRSTCAGTTVVLVLVPVVLPVLGGP